LSESFDGLSLRSTLDGCSFAAVNKPIRDVGDKLFGVLTGFSAPGTLPYLENAPVSIEKSLHVPAITVTVDLNFIPPESSAGLGQSEQVTVMAVPEASVNKHYSVVFREDQIRSPREG
jgi:hypothetical protein